jgi:hypothetical protein
MPKLSFESISVTIARISFVIGFFALLIFTAQVVASMFGFSKTIYFNLIQISFTCALLAFPTLTIKPRRGEDSE